MAVSTRNKELKEGANMAGYAPKLLRVNLSQGTIKEENIPEAIVKDFVGGRGLGIKYLYDELSPGIDPLHAENKLLFSIGPLAGTGALSASRWIVTTKSPLTGTYYRSVAGADFGAWLKFAGLDLIIVEGKATKPVYVYIGNGRRELRDASHLWGKGTVETQERLKETHGARTRVACIGPAGEKLVRYACIISDRRAAGRGGVGTVMGSKNLKAIAINAIREGKLSAEYKNLIHEQIIAINYNMLFPVFSEFGSLMITERMNAMGGFPTRNFREGSLKGWQNITGDRYLLIKEKNTSCYGCTIHCGNIFAVENGPYAGATSEGPDYETVSMFTGSIGSADMGATVVADALCDDLGIDTISAGNSIGFAYELFGYGRA
jgi:aldehyde:ferredoxin oxidoreductase